MKGMVIHIRGPARFWFVAVLFITVGIVFAFLVPWLNARIARERTAVAQGRIVGFEEQERITGRSRRIYFYPRIAFRTEAGREVQHVSSIGSTSPPYAPGDAVTVRYEPWNPSNAEIEGSSRGLIVAFQVLGAVFFSIGVIMLGLMCVSLMVKKRMPHNLLAWYWWMNFVGGCVGVVVFVIPSVFAPLIAARLVPQSVATHPILLRMVFPFVGICAAIFSFFIARRQYYGRPRWRNG